jgi:hypothetical protein
MPQDCEVSTSSMEWPMAAVDREYRHWVINSLTAKYHLGHSFEEHYEDPYAPPPAM